MIVLFQFAIILSGNLSFLNWLTIVPALACFDDGFWSKLLPGWLVKKAQAAAANAEESVPMLTTTWVITLVIILLSVKPVLNLFSSSQIMNTSFDPLELVNTYGAFGTVGQERLNIVFEGSMDGKHWAPYVYKGLPTLPNQSPPQIAPYQLHLDWQLWFAAMSTADQYPWTYNLVWKLLHNDPNTISLFAGNPFPDSPPRYIRASLYRYSFAKPGNPQGLYWIRERLSDWISPLSSNNAHLIKFLEYKGWIPDE